jgi:hypothetical protein
MTSLNAQDLIITSSTHGKGKLSPGKIMNRKILTCGVVGAIFMVSAIQAQEPVGSSEMMTR